MGSSSLLDLWRDGHLLMSLVRFAAQNHPQQQPKEEVDDRATHPTDFAVFNARFGFTVDVAAAAHNTKCERYYDRETDGLAQSWAGEVVWCNPPYSAIGPTAWTADQGMFAVGAS